MTDKENIKALECLAGFALKCIECPYSPRYQFPLCQRRVAKEALDLIDRQQAEIERLKIESQSLRMAANSYKLHYNEEIVKAVRDFAETLKFVWFDFSYDSPDVDFDCFVDTLVKEKVGDMNENLD